MMPGAGRLPSAAGARFERSLPGALQPVLPPLCTVGQGRLFSSKKPPPHGEMPPALLNKRRPPPVAMGL